MPWWPPMGSSWLIFMISPLTASIWGTYAQPLKQINPQESIFHFKLLDISFRCILFNSMSCCVPGFFDCIYSRNSVIVSSGSEYTVSSLIVSFTRVYGTVVSRMSISLLVWFSSIDAFQSPKWVLALLTSCFSVYAAFLLHVIMLIVRGLSSEETFDHSSGLIRLWDSFSCSIRRRVSSSTSPSVGL